MNLLPKECPHDQTETGPTRAGTDDGSRSDRPVTTEDERVDAKFDGWRAIEAEGKAALERDIEETRRPFAGKLKQLRRNPYPENTPEAESWEMGYNEALVEFFIR